MLYTLGRGWIETLRIDDVELNDVRGLRFNVWTSIVLFVAAWPSWSVVAPAPRPSGRSRVYRAPAASPPTTPRLSAAATGLTQSAATTAWAGRPGHR